MSTSSEIARQFCIEKYCILNKTKHIAVLIMAAGSSSRMGEPKQLLKWKDVTLIENSINKVLQMQISKPIVVIGANSKKISPKIEPYSIEVIHNPNWARGLGNSIAFGVNHIKNNYQMDGVLMVLADQPLIKASYLIAMLDLFQISKDQIIATQYKNGKLGVPALFDRCYFNELSTIDGDKGAKSILKKHSNSVIKMKLATNVFDVDTEEDYRKLFDSSNH